MQTIAIRPLGPTYALSVANTQHAGVQVTPTGTEQSKFAAFTNSGSVDVCISVYPVNQTQPTLVFPVDGAPTVPNSFLLHANAVSQPIILEVPVGGFMVTAIGAAAGPTILYVTPVGSL